MSGPRFHFITLFPETISVWFSTSIPGRAIQKEIFEIRTIQLRDFGSLPHRSVDAPAYGGGSGMVLAVEPLVKATEHILGSLDRSKTRVIAFTPGGKILNTSLLTSFHQANYDDYILICGHYEGIDQRFLDGWVDEEVSLGDFVLTGGELPAVAFVDAFVRGLAGTLRDASSVANESFSIEDPDTGARLLEYPHYTRPAEYAGRTVPEVLLSGDHKAIAEWRLTQSRKRTLAQKHTPN